MRVALFRLDERRGAACCKSVVLDADGRADAPLLEGAEHRARPLSPASSRSAPTSRARGARSPSRRSSTRCRSTSASPRSTSTTTCRCSPAPGPTRPIAAADARAPQLCIRRMDAYWLDWANLLLRWAHVITGIAWIGASFYFVGLDNSLTPPADQADRAKGVGGELWAVHGGGFYHQQKYPVSPARLPEHLHWSMWESYSTWLTGFALFTVLYLFNASTFLIDKSVFDWSPARGDRRRARLLRRLLARLRRHLPRLRRAARTATSSSACWSFAFIVFASWLSCHLFAGRAAFLLVGAMMATTMTRQRLLLDHPRPAQGRRGAARRPAGRPGARPARQAAQRAQHLLHAAGRLRDDQQPLRLPLRRAPQLARAGAC